MGWVQRFEERHQGRGLSRAEIIAVRGHIASPLQDLADQFVAREPRCHGVKRRAALTAFAPKSVAVATLFVLEDHGALSFKGRAAFE